ncbi:MAG: fatty acid hydroxylase family protein [Alphaproteobacteria bacterium]|nr:fatty acid hydroxylase family protein [Alphaproteobacteria bacterium]
MTLKDLLYAYFSYPVIQLYVVLAAVALAVALALHGNWAMLALILILSPLVYSLVEYFFHRYVLHNRTLYRHKATSAFWKRVHFDHHQDPSDFSVLFGDPKTTLPPIFVIASPLGYVFNGYAGSAMAVFCGIVLTSAYEFCHLYQHLPYEPRSAYLRRLKKRHLAHHFHNETGNFGITTHLWDVVFGTNYDSVRERPRSGTVRNLGYAGEEAARYPWVTELGAARSTERTP